MTTHFNKRRLRQGSRKRVPWQAIAAGAAVLLGALLPYFMNAANLAITAGGRATTVVLSVILIVVGLAPPLAFRPRRLAAGSVALVLPALLGLFCAFA